MPPPFILGLKNILDRNDKSELVPHLENSVRIIISWSEWRDLNPRPHGPELSSLCPICVKVSRHGGIAHFFDF